MISQISEKIKNFFLLFEERHFKIFILILFLIPLSLVIISGWILNQKVRNIVIENFNQQQLVLAKYTAFQIKNSLDILKRELNLLSLSPSIQYLEFPAFVRRMEITFMSVKYEGVKEIIFIDKKERKYVVYDVKSFRIEKGVTKEEKNFLKWASNRENLNKIFYTEVEKLIEKDGTKLFQKMVTPVYQISIDEAHPVPTYEFSGVLIFKVDIGELVKKVAKNVVSGKTGYAWVIDNKGIFLYHPNEEFIGEDAFKVREEKASFVVFERINFIQKEKMLKGQEGTDWYVSEWHRGKIGIIKKLIAYSPIFVSDSIIWSIAVVVPVNEVEGTIKSVQIFHTIFLGVITFIILLGGIVIIVFLMKWSELLEKEVIRKTEELKRSEEKYRSLIENAEDIIFKVDEEGKIVSINKFAEKFFGLDEKKLIGKDVEEMFYPEGKKLRDMIKRVFETLETIEITNKVQVEDNEYWFSTKLGPLKDEKGKVYAVLGISRDITEKKKMEEQIYFTEKLAALGTLAAGIAHEINNPLTIIFGFSDFLTEKIPKDSEEYKILEIIKKQTIKAKNIVENLLSFARTQKSKEELIDINQCLETVLSVLYNTLFIHNIKVVKNFEKDLPRVLGNFEELEQVFFNIINNAKDAMKNGGTLTITTKKIDGWIEIVISDTGCGIKPEHRHKIFDPFFTTKEPGKGTGLGLYVAYAIIKKHEGTITFETKTKEESSQPGTTFYIRLPAYKKQEEKKA